MVDHRYIRHNNWKLVSVDGEPWELFDLARDRTETENRIGNNPEVAEGLKRAWEKWYGSFSDKPFGQIKGTPPNMRMGDEGGGARYAPVAIP